jgi:hypothetical protein
MNEMGCYDTLSDMLKVAVTIYRLKRCGRISTKDEIGKEMNWEINEIALITALNELVNIGTVDVTWRRVANEYEKVFEIGYDSERFIGEITGKCDVE